MTAIIALAALAPFAAGLTYALWANRHQTTDRPRADGYANEWAARKGALPATGRHRGTAY